MSFYLKIIPGEGIDIVGQGKLNSTCALGTFDHCRKLLNYLKNQSEKDLSPNLQELLPKLEKIMKEIDGDI